ncbi:putative fatty acyl-CoA reductase CG5065 isoform X1 [Lycorma delicatula]|uniref:putative fatty acyl-CoA reductase CG5065 isoform X1 n=1 Tax=Lycorma delicatula TaxID=130591 RepID=UPI003F519364
MFSSVLPREYNNYTSVSEFYKNRCIFITGGTGFMGKVLVYKLLKSCPGIKYVFLLMRPKRGESVDARLSKLTNRTFFSKLKTNDPLVLNKIIPISGDVSQPKLGISIDDQKVLYETVSVVFHLAATVKFDETLKDSVSINVLGTQRLIELCHSMTHLVALIHVSTAFSNCDRGEVTEVIYPPPFKPEQIIQCVDCMEDNLLKVITPKLLGKHPNTYTFTKALAEHIILTEHGKLPTAIVRPSVVLSSLIEPSPGWVDNWNGPNKIIAVFGRGCLRSVLVHKEKRVDLIPVDVVVNLLICAAWQTALSKPDEVIVYNCCSGQLNPISWGNFIQLSIEAMLKFPTTQLLLKPKVSCYNNRYASYISDIILHIIPAITCDFVLFMIGKKPCYYEMHRKLSEELSKLQYFGLNEWLFLDYNVQMLNRLLHPLDRKEFFFDVTQIDWQHFIEGYVYGIRKYILKEQESTLCYARSRQTRLLWFERIFKLLTAVMVLSLSLSVWLKKVSQHRYIIFNLILRFLRFIRECYEIFA